jgi:hypothetical protein
MAAMTPEDLARELAATLEENLHSVVLYGSGAAGDFVPGVSHFDVLIVAQFLGVPELKAISQALLKWQAEGNPAPQLFTPAELAASADAFPIELLDMQQSRRVLHGSDPLAEIQVDREHFRLQLEHELKSRLNLLRRHYLGACGEPLQVARLMTSSVSTFLVLFRACLRLYDEPVPPEKLLALRALARRLDCDLRPLENAQALKLVTPAGKVEADHIQSLFSQYLTAIETVVHAVDRHLHAENAGG